MDFVLFVSVVNVMVVSCFDVIFIVVLARTVNKRKKKWVELNGGGDCHTPFYTVPIPPTTHTRRMLSY